MRFSVPDELPAVDILRREGILLNSGSFSMQRPLKILLLNLMPTKTVTETQLIRMLASANCDFELSLMKTVSYTSKNADSDYMQRFYRGFGEYKNMYFDGFIVTGAPVELLDYTQVLYWNELCRILDWAQTHVKSIYAICWGAQAVLYHFYGIRKHELPQKMFGVFDHELLEPSCEIANGLPSTFAAPHSRHTEIYAEDILKIPDLTLVSQSAEAGVNLVASKDMRLVCCMGHPEYDSDTLSREYFRDLERGEKIAMPKHYFPGNDPALIPPLSWRDAGKTVYGNWMKFINKNK